MMTFLPIQILWHCISRHQLLSGAAALVAVLAMGGFLPFPFFQRNKTDQTDESDSTAYVQEEQAPYSQDDASSAKSSHWELTPGQQETLKQLEFSEEGFDWRRDWWKYLALGFAAILLLLLILYITHLFFRVIIAGVTLALSLLATLFVGPCFQPWMENHVPENIADKIPPAYLAYVIAFLMCHLCLSLIAKRLVKNR